MTSTSIKGGGRVSFPPQVEENLISLLWSLHNPQHPATLVPTTIHDRQREYKRFLQTLVERNERQAMVRKLRIIPKEMTIIPSSSGPIINSSTSSLVPQPSETMMTTTKKATTKVRVTVVEAIYNDSSSGSKHNKEKTKQSVTFVEGAKKVVVLARSMSITELLQQTKTKLRMKKKPVRCFIIGDANNIEVDIIDGDLQGLKDDDTLYVTSTTHSDTQQIQQRHQQQVDDDKKQADQIAKEEDIADPLDAVKQAYLQQKLKQRGRFNHTSRFPRRTGEHPIFSNFFDKLPPISEERDKLPAAACREIILKSIEGNRVVIVCGATGSGKSTQIPQFILEGMIASGQQDCAHILVTQPRRVAATSLAHRVAYELQSPKPGREGSQVGYHVRLDRAVSDSANIVYCTVGILLRMLICPKEINCTDGVFLEEDDEEKGDEDGVSRRTLVPLSNISHIVIDEVHERDLNTDFTLTLLRLVLAANKNIRVILMSATASAQLFVQYFRGDIGTDPTIVEIPGRIFPVEIKWISDCERFAGCRVQGWTESLMADEQTDCEEETDANKLSKQLSPRAVSAIDNKFLANLIRSIVQDQQSKGEIPLSERDDVTKSDGAILVFLPGKGEIESLARLLYRDHLLGNKNMCKIFKLHSCVSKTEQVASFKLVKKGAVKIVLATNIAETSITIPGKDTAMGMLLPIM